MKTPPIHNAKQPGPATVSVKQPQDTETNSLRTTESDDSLRDPRHTHGETMSLKDRKRKKTYTTTKTTNEQPPDLTTDSFPAVLGSLSFELWEILLMTTTCVTDRFVVI